MPGPASIHTNDRADLSAIIEALFLLSPSGSVARGSQACVFYDSKHAANVCMGTIQSRTNVRLGMTSQQCLVQAQLRLRITMHRIFSHGQNVGNERADHAAALGALGLTSNQNTWNR